METKFTKGEWKISKGEYGLYDHIIDEKGCFIAEVKSYDIGRKYPSRRERKANSKLIAAAPEMYEALRKILEGTSPATEFEAFIFVDLAKSIAEQALKKATE